MNKLIKVIHSAIRKSAFANIAIVKIFKSGNFEDHSAKLSTDQSGRNICLASEE
jgi:hypothetical protein